MLESALWDQTDAWFLILQCCSCTAVAAAGCLTRSQPQVDKTGCRWNGEVKAGDKIERAHHRHVRSCRLEGGPVPLAPGGPAALKIVIVGDSFMLHQIRWVQRADRLRVWGVECLCM